MKQIQVVKVGLQPGTSGLQFRPPNHSISFSEPAVPLSSGTDNERLSLPVPLNKGNAGSGNEIANH